MLKAQTYIHHVLELKLPLFMRFQIGKYHGTVMNKKVDKDCIFDVHKRNSEIFIGKLRIIKTIFLHFSSITWQVAKKGLKRNIFSPQF